ncbi:MAG: hypothetical protein SwBeaMacB_13590 [Shewanella algae]
MIITQQIINGVCSVTKTGSYFNLISAGGVVRVKLTKNGSTVLDSKMWVGMNLDKAQPFDEVEIYGEDGPIEFWAGEISMQHFAFGNDAARAARSNVTLVTGLSQIVGADLTRKAVRVRSDKTVFLGGAGFGADGWRLAPGETVEFPLAGILSAYKPQAFLDYSNPNDVGVVAGFWPADNGTGECYVSADEQTRVYNRSGTLRVTTDGGDTWNSTKTGVNGYVVDKRTGIHYLSQRSSEISIFSRSYDGVEWEPMFRGSPESPAGTNYSVYGPATVTGRKFQRNYSGFAHVFDIETGELKVTPLTKEALLLSRGQWIDDTQTVGIFMAGSKIFKTDDSGQTWRELSSADSGSFFADESGERAIITIGGYPYLSEDSGESWVKCGTVSWGGGSIPIHVYENLWVCHRTGRFQYASLENGSGAGDYLSADSGIGYSASDIYLSPQTGVFYISRVNSNGNQNGQQCGIEILGDITAARVEVMELLA